MKASSSTILRGMGNGKKSTRPKMPPSTKNIGKIKNFKRDRHRETEKKEAQHSPPYRNGETPKKRSGRKPGIIWNASSKFGETKDKGGNYTRESRKRVVQPQKKSRLEEKSDGKKEG